MQTPPYLQPGHRVTWVLGLDGGGSKTALAYAGPDGEVVGPFYAPGINPFDRPDWETGLTAFLQAHRLPAGAVSAGIMRDTLQNRLVRRHGPGNWVLSYENQQVYLNRTLASQKKIDFHELSEEVVQTMVQLPGVSRALTAEDIQKSHCDFGSEWLPRAFPSVDANVFWNSKEMNSTFKLRSSTKIRKDRIGYTFRLTRLHMHVYLARR